MLKPTPKRLLCGLLLSLVALASGCNSSDRSPSVLPKEAELGEGKLTGVHAENDRVARAMELLEENENESAEDLLRQHLVLHPDDAPALFLMARCQSRRGDLQSAIKTLELIPPDHPEAGVPALGQAADWLIRSQDYGKAEQRLRMLISRAPQLVVAHRRLAQLLNAEGRRSEAMVPMRSLASLGAATEPELYGMTAFSEPFIHRDESSSIEMSQSKLCKARLKWFDGDLDGAKLLMEETVREAGAGSAAWAYYGKILSVLQADDEFSRWLIEVPKDVEQEPEYWHALALWYQRSSAHPLAIRCFLENVERDDTDAAAYLGLARSLLMEEQTDQAQRAETRSEQLREISYIVSELHPTADQYKRLIELLLDLGRIDEARCWSLKTGLTNELPAMDSASPVSRTCGIDKSNWPLPDKLTSRLARKDQDTRDQDVRGKQEWQASPLRLADVATSVNLNVRYQGAGGPNIDSLKMYQVTGAGVAVLDYDRDGWSDLYFGQGADLAIRSSFSGGNELQRNLGGKAFLNVAGFASADDQGYAQGVSHADLNQDGFSDLLVGNIGSVVVLINNGDGTFQPASIPSKRSYSWNSSIAAADLDGDQIPEIVALQYTDDRDIIEVPCLATAGTSCSPQAFERASMVVYRQTGHGAWEAWPQSEYRGVASYGLGLLIGELTLDAGNELFIANDTEPNMLYVHPNNPGGDGIRMVDQAQLRGCAVGLSGQPGGSMGIVAGDFDRNGLIDLHITNFANEPCDLFLQSEGGIFSNGAVRYAIADLSTPMVGWGTQAADFDGDGWLDLVVLNGHIYPDHPNGSPFRMLPQYLAGGPEGFRSRELSDEFWTRPSLGRSLAKLDWNRDGQMDLIATHLDQPAALLENDTHTSPWLQFELIGHDSERGAVGARIKTQTNHRVVTDWLTTGDGFQCRNESIVSVPLKASETLIQVEVAWPSGHVQAYDELESDRRYLLVEGQMPFPLD